MTKRLVVLVLALSVAACWTEARPRPTQNPTPVATETPTPEPTPTPVPTPTPTARGSVIGEWSETWGIPGQTDVTYHDTYVVVRDGGQLALSSPGRESYRFLKVSFDGSRLLVTLENNGTVIDYDLVLEPGGAKLTGRAKTNRGVDVPIVWDRK